MDYKVKREFEGGVKEPPMRKLELLQSNDPSSIFCVGDSNTILKFECGPMTWMRIPIDNDEKS